MQHSRLNRATLQVADTTEICGRVTAKSVKRGFCAKKKSDLSRICALAIFGSVVSLAPMPARAQGLSGGLNGVKEFTLSGSFVVPAGITHLLVEMWGGGSDVIPGGAGGGGAYARSVITVIPGSTLTVQVGSHGFNTTSAIFDAAGSNLIFAGGGVQVNGGTDDTRAMIHHPGNPASSVTAGGAAYRGNSNPPIGFDGAGGSVAPSPNGNPGYVLLLW
jgi:hypothetical protein